MSKQQKHLHGALVRIRSLVATLIIFSLGNIAVADIYSTLSEPAAAFLRNTEPLELKPKNMAEWKAFAQADGEPGVLSEADEAFAKEYGAVVSTRDIAGTQHVLVEPLTFKPDDKRIILYVHGGAYTLARPELVASSFIKIANLTGARVLGIRYPLAWQAKRPAQSDRVMEVYREVLKTHPARSVVMVGDSAGASLIMTSVLRIRDADLPMPAALGLLSPWADLSKTGTSLYTLADGGDPILDWDKGLAASAKLYAGDAALTDPAVSPLYADFTAGFPPSYISTGTTDLFLSHCARLQRVLTDAGVVNNLFVYEGMWHVFQQDFSLPETESAWQDLAQFLKRYWAR